MAVEDVQQLIDLLEATSDVAELTLRSESGNKVTIKRRLSAVGVASTAIVATDYETAGALEEILQPEPARPMQTISATLVGLYHEANPPIFPGAQVVVGQIVGYIESMRLMNEIVSTVEGSVDSVAASEGQPVEYGQTLFLIAG